MCMMIQRILNIKKPTTICILWFKYFIWHTNEESVIRPVLEEKVSTLDLKREYFMHAMEYLSPT